MAISVCMFHKTATVRLMIVFFCLFSQWITIWDDLFMAQFALITIAYPIQCSHHFWICIYTSYAIISCARNWFRNGTCGEHWILIDFHNDGWTFSTDGSFYLRRDKNGIRYCIGNSIHWIAIRQWFWIRRRSKKKEDAKEGIKSFFLKEDGETSS